MTLAAVIWAVCATIFTLVALARIRRPSAPAPCTPWPGVLLVRPLDLPSPEEIANLSAPIDYDGALDHVVAAPARPDGLAHGVQWIASDPDVPNRKVGHLLSALAREPVDGRIVLAVDADVRVDGALMRALVAPIAHGVALSTAAPSPGPGPSITARAVRALLCNTHHDFMALYAMSAGAPAISGKALGLGATALQELPRLVDHVGEDLEMAVRLHARGARVALATARARVPQPDPLPLPTTLARFTRWMLVLRSHRPGLYPTVPLLLAPSLPLLAVALITRTPAVLCAVLGLWLARSALAFRLAPRSARDWPLGEALLLAAFCASLGRRTVRWRGRTLRLRTGGRIELLADHKSAQ